MLPAPVPAGASFTAHLACTGSSERAAAPPRPVTPTLNRSVTRRRLGPPGRRRANAGRAHAL